MKAELVPENGDPPIPITKDVTVVGRRDFCDVTIDHPSLSKRHCVIVKTDGLLVIRDLASTNGTKVKGQRIRWAALLPDDRIALGNYKLRVYLGADHLPSPSELYRGRVPNGISPARSAVTNRAGAANGLSFPEPSPLEIDLSTSGHDAWPSPPTGRKEQVPLISIDLDDEDEGIINLD